MDNFCGHCINFNWNICQKLKKEKKKVSWYSEGPIGWVDTSWTDKETCISLLNKSHYVVLNKYKQSE
jgi:hypothetical protein